MCKYMPKDGFSWYEGNLEVENVLKLLESSNEKSNIGYSLEVDILYPQSLHDEHNELPYLSERIVPPGSKIKKLIANLQHKKKYVVHYMALKQATKMRKNALNDFERDFFKLMNNAVFGMFFFYYHTFFLIFFLIVQGNPWKM